jgi:hypothetical protein
LNWREFCSRWAFGPRERKRKNYRRGHRDAEGAQTKQENREVRKNEEDENELDLRTNRGAA